MFLKAVKSRAREGFTLTEVLVAAMLLTLVMVPILKGLTSAHSLDIKVERRMRSLTLAEAKLEDIRGRSIYNYGLNFNDPSSSLDGAYLCRVSDVPAGLDLRSIVVSVGYDENGSGLLEGGEVEVTLKTLIAKRW
jgi:prepilin-type N-terminal cleavage/methylation domain-containing protein